MSEQRAVAGWREWLAMPNLTIEKIEAKVDTGTEFSLLHVSFIESFRKQAKLWLRFGIQPLPDRTDIRLVGFAPVKERRLIKDAEGSEEVCFIIETDICIGRFQRQIELALTTKDSMRFRMVLGRSSLQSLNLLVDSSQIHQIEPQWAEKKSPLQYSCG